MRSSIKVVIKNKEAVFIYAMFIMVMMITIINKKNLHVDEVSSYILSNNVGGISMDFKEGYTYMPTEQVYLDCVAANESERFNFRNVWKNQTDDVHPPFYYLLLHMICSLNAGKFSVWHAAAINIFFAVMTLYILRKLLYLFVKDIAFIDFCSIAFSLSAGILQNVSFFRMYVMAMFWVTLMAYLLIQAFGEGFSWKRWTQIGFTAIAGALTHYYCIIYLSASCLILGICLIIGKRWKDIAALMAYMLCAAAVSIAIFPAMLNHMFFGYRGTQSIDNLTQTTSMEQWERIKNFYGFLNTQMLGKIGGGGILFAIFIIIMLALRKKQDGEHFVFDKQSFMKWMILLIPPILYFIFVSESAAYVTDRYLFPIYAVIFGLFLCIMMAVWKKIVAVQYINIVICLIATIFIVNGYSNAHWDYLYKSSVPMLNKAETFSDNHCICVYDAKWKEQSAFFEVKNYKSVTFISQENINRITQYEKLFQSGFILTVIGGNDMQIINMIQSNYPYLNKYEEIGKFAYAVTYRIYAGEESLNVRILDYNKRGNMGADSFDLGSNVLLAQNELDMWLIRQDEEHAVIELGRQVLDVSGGVYAEGTNIQLFTANGTDAQRWKFIGNEDGSFSLLSKDERFALTCGSDNNIYLAEYHAGDKSQCWWIEKIK